MNTHLIREALQWAKQLHEGQIREGSGLDYIVHIISVFSIVKKYKESKFMVSILCAAILHDVMEDCGVKYEEIYKRFGKMTADLVQELTNDPAEIARIGKEEYMNKKLIGLTSYALVIKLADMSDNLSDRPTGKMSTRIRNNLLHLVAKRELSRTQQRILGEINQIFMHSDILPVVYIPISA